MSLIDKYIHKYIEEICETEEDKKFLYQICTYKNILENILGEEVLCDFSPSEFRNISSYSLDEIYFIDNNLNEYYISYIKAIERDRKINEIFN